MNKVTQTSISIFFIAILSLPLFMSTGYVFFVHRRQIISEAKTTELTSMESIENSAIQGMRNQIEFLRLIMSSDSVTDLENALISQNQTKIDISMENLEEFFISLGQTIPDILQLRYIDISGMEKVRVNVEPDISSQDHHSIYSVPKNELQDKSNRSYYHEILELNTSQIYISHLNLNQEFGEIEMVDGEPLPVMRYAATIDYNNLRYGFVILNFHWSIIIEQVIDESLITSNHGHILMVDSDGYILFNTYTGEEWTDPENFGTGVTLSDILGTETKQLLVSSSQTMINGNYVMVDRLDILFTDSGYQLFLINVLPIDEVTAQSTLILIILLAAATFTMVVGLVMWYQSGRKLSLTSKRHLNLINSISGVLWEYSLQERKFVFVSSQLVSITGYKTNELLEEPKLICQKTHPNDPCFQNEIEKLIEIEQSSINYQFRLQNTSGEYIWLQNSITIIKSASEPIRVAGIIHNIEKLKEAENELLKAKETLHQAQKVESLGQLAGSIAHDFNNLLSVFMGNISLLDLENKDDTLQPFIQGIEFAIEKGQYLTSQILTFSKGGEPQLESVNIIELVRLSTENIFRNEEFPYILNLPKSEIINKVDSTQIYQVIQNVLVNAINASKPTDPIIIEVKCDVVPSFDQEKLYSEIKIKDRGTGIKESDLENVFDPFFTTRTKGSGLGLAISKSIIEKHGGQIHIESLYHQGTTVKIYLPQIELSGVDPNARNLGSITNDQIAFEGKILVMDDNQEFCKILTFMFLSLGFEVYSVSNGAEAMKYLDDNCSSNNCIDLVMLDLIVENGPGGLEIIDKINEKYPDIIKIVMSGFFESPVLSNPTEYGFDGKISKPFNLINLKELLLIYFNPVVEVTKFQDNKFKEYDE